MAQSAYENGVCGLAEVGKFAYKVPYSDQTSVFNAFFSPQNIRYLQTEIEKALTLLVGQPVRVPVNDEFMQTMYDVVDQNQGLAYMGNKALDSLNEMVVEWETRIQYVSLRQQYRYQHWIVDMDQQTFMPYPASDRTLRGEVVIDTSGYTLTSPFKNNWGNYLQDVLHIGPNSGPPCPRNPPNQCPYSSPVRT